MVEVGQFLSTPGAALMFLSGFGLIGMQERAAVIGGTLEIETAPGKGTTVFVQVPLPPQTEPS